MKKLIFLSTLVIASHLTAMERPFEEFAQDFPFYNVKELKELFLKSPLDVQKIIARMLHEAHGWISLPNGNCYNIQKDLIMGKHQVCWAYPWRLKHKNNKLTLLFNNPETHTIKSIMTVPCSEHQVPCEQFRVIGPNQQLHAIVRNQFVDLKNPNEPVPLLLDFQKGENVQCIHPRKSKCASYDLAGNLTIYSWLKHRLIKVKKLKTHATGDGERNHTGTQLNFNTHNYLSVFHGNILRIIDFKKDSLILQLNASTIMHEQDKSAYFTDCAWCPKTNNLLLLSYSLVGAEKIEFLAEIASDRKHHYALFDIQNHTSIPLQLQRTRTESKVMWNKLLQSYHKRRLHLCENFCNTELPKNLNLTLVSIKNQDDMLATLKAWFDLHKKNE